MCSIAACVGFAALSCFGSSGVSVLLCTVPLTPGDAVGEPVNTSACFSVCGLRDVTAREAAGSNVRTCPRTGLHKNSKTFSSSVGFFFFSFQIPETC